MEEVFVLIADVGFHYRALSLGVRFYNHKAVNGWSASRNINNVLQTAKRGKAS